MNPLRLNPVGPLATTTPVHEPSGLAPGIMRSGTVLNPHPPKTIKRGVHGRATTAERRALAALSIIKEEEEQKEKSGEGNEDKKNGEGNEGKNKEEGVREYVFRLGGPDLSVPVSQSKRSVWRSRARRAWRFCTHFFVGTKMSGRERMMG